MVTLDNLMVSYRGHPAVHHLSGCFASGSLTAVVGPNGAGKSTLLKAIVGLLPSARGTLQVSVPRRQIAYLPQVSDIDRSFPIDVADCVLLGAWSAAGAWGPVTAPLRERAASALQAVGLEGFDHRPIGSLSSGQLQRVMFARLLVQDAELILLDEPFSAIDARTSQALMQLVLQWHARGRTVVVVLHDDALVRAAFPDTLLIARERVGWGATEAVLTEAGIRRARAMAEAWDDSAAMCEIDDAPSMRAVP